MVFRSLSKIRRIYCGCAGGGQIFRSFSLHSPNYSPQTIETSDSNQHPLVTIANLGQAPRKIKKCLITTKGSRENNFTCLVAETPVWQGARTAHTPVWKGRATPSDWMDQRPNWGRYSCASPKVTTPFLYFTMHANTLHGFFAPNRHF